MATRLQSYSLAVFWCLIAAVITPRASAQVRVVGRVSNETDTPVAGAKITAAPIPPAKNFTAISGPTGTFVLLLPSAGKYSLRIERDGFYIYSEPALIVPAESPDTRALPLSFALQSIHRLLSVVDVKDQVAAVDMDRTTPETTLSSRTLYNIPFPDQNSLRSGFRLIPGVLQDSAGGLHLFGGAETQTEFTFEGFQLNDPLTAGLTRA